MSCGVISVAVMRPSSSARVSAEMKALASSIPSLLATTSCTTAAKMFSLRQVQVAQVSWKPLQTAYPQILH